MMDEEVDPTIKREKHKENRVMNVGCKDEFLDNPITKLIKKEVEVEMQATLITFKIHISIKRLLQ